MKYFSEKTEEVLKSIQEVPFADKSIAISDTMSKLFCIVTSLDIRYGYNLTASRHLAWIHNPDKADKVVAELKTEIVGETLAGYVQVKYQDSLEGLYEKVYAVISCLQKACALTGVCKKYGLPTSETTGFINRDRLIGIVKKETQTILCDAIEFRAKFISHLSRNPTYTWMTITRGENSGGIIYYRTYTSQEEADNDRVAKGRIYNAGISLISNPHNAYAPVDEVKLVEALLDLVSSLVDEMKD